jgi:hypothetical protein
VAISIALLIAIYISIVSGFKVPLVSVRDPCIQHVLTQVGRIFLSISFIETYGLDSSLLVQQIFPIGYIIIFDYNLLIECL